MDFAASLASGPHATLASIAGSWSGTATLWFEPGEPHSVDHVELAAETISDGRALRMTYRSAMAGRPTTGELLVGFHLHDAQWQGAWSDASHTGTQLMLLEGEPGVDPAARPLVRGSYPGGEDRWGWQVSWIVDGDDLVVLHDNVPLAGAPVRALEWKLRRDA